MASRGLLVYGSSLSPSQFDGLFNSVDELLVGFDNHFCQLLYYNSLFRVLQLYLFRTLSASRLIIIMFFSQQIVHIIQVELNEAHLDWELSLMHSSMNLFKYCPGCSVKYSRFWMLYRWLRHCLFGPKNCVSLTCACLPVCQECSVVTFEYLGD